MNYSYYPGCTLKNKAKDLERYARLSAEALGVHLEEIEEWQCCGGVYPMAKNEVATRLSSVRTLNAAKERQQTLVTVCSACHHVIKRVNEDMKTNETIRKKANLYLELSDPYQGETKVLHYLELLRDEIGFDEVKKRVVHSLKGRKIGAYYGCLLLRPSDEMQLDDAENPTIMEDLLRALGAVPIVYSQRNECCGGYVVVKDKNFAKKRCDIILQSAKEKGAEEIITACPLCMYNLKQNGSIDIPVRYFTEVLAEALGLKEEE
ncbi:MAG: CoB--CoM heterodisulfide reductase iron-sulfur subunit B family protein [Lachnospiraceae bacterium]